MDRNFKHIFSLLFLITFFYDICQLQLSRKPIATSFKLFTIRLAALKKNHATQHIIIRNYQGYYWAV